MISIVIMSTVKETCPICNEIRTNIKRHIKLVHEKVQPYVFEICENACSLQYNLEEHILLYHFR